MIQRHENQSRKDVWLREAQKLARPSHGASTSAREYLCNCQFRQAVFCTAAYTPACENILHGVGNVPVGVRRALLNFVGIAGIIALTS